MLAGNAMRALPVAAIALLHTADALSFPLLVGLVLLAAFAEAEGS